MVPAAWPDFGSATFSVLSGTCLSTFPTYFCACLLEINFLGTDCYRLPRHKFVIFCCNNVCLCQFLTDFKHIRTRFVSFDKLVYMQSVKQYTNQYNVKFKILCLINENACVFRYFSIGQSFCPLAFLFWLNHYIVRKLVDHIRNILWSKLSSKLLTVPDHNKFSCIAVNFQER